MKLKRACVGVPSMFNPTSKLCSTCPAIQQCAEDCLAVANSVYLSTFDSTLYERVKRESNLAFRKLQVQKIERKTVVEPENLD